MDGTGKIYIGTASWNIPKDAKAAFSEEGSHLERYAQKFNAVEINSSFYKEHQLKTYQKWAAMVPEDFRFSVKLSQTFTHEMKLELDQEKLSESLNSVMGLGEKLGVLLIQLPPSLAFNEKESFLFFKYLREVYKGNIALEPRNISWTWKEALDLLKQFHIPRVFADPESKATNPVWSKQDHLFYYRLHGSPQIYKSSYEEEALMVYGDHFLDLKKQGDVWCIFDNTAYGYATENAMQLNLATQLMGEIV